MSNRAKLVNPFCYNPRITAQYIVCTQVTSCHLTRNQSRNLNQISWHGTITTYQQPALYCCNVIALFKHFHASLWNIFVFHLFFSDAYLIWFGWKYWMKYCCLASLILQYFWKKMKPNYNYDLDFYILTYGSMKHLIQIALRKKTSTSFSISHCISIKFT